MKQESPPPRARRHVGHHQAHVPLAPTREVLDGVLTTLSMSRRPRDLTWTAERTWEGVGRQGEGKEEDLRLEVVADRHPEAAAESWDDVDGSDEFDEELDRKDEVEEDAVVDQALEDLPRGDLLQRQRP